MVSTARRRRRWVPRDRTPTRSTTRSPAGWRSRGSTLYPHQDEAVIELLGGNNVVLATPTGSGKSLVAIGGARRRAGRATG